MPNSPEQNWIIPRVSPAAAGPLYAQIVDAVKRAISEGRLKPGEALPSFRALAEELLVSLITVKRAYEDLEREGIIFRKQGLGTFVSEDGPALSRALKRREVVQLLRQALREAAETGLSEAELLAMVQQLIQEREA